MNIVIVGAGAVGGYFGAKMAKAGLPVTFLVREKRYQQIKERGLHIKSVHGDFSIQPYCVSSPKEVENPDLVILSVKNYHLEGTLADLATFVERGAKILPLLNGVKHIDRLISAFGREHVLGGLCYIESTLNESGDIIQKSEMQDIIFGSLSEQDPMFLQEIEALFIKSGVNVKLSQEILNEMWSKYIFLVTLSGITSATRSPIGVSKNDPVTFDFLKDLVEELIMVAKANKINLSDNFSKQMMTRIMNTAPAMTSSMHRDLEKGLPLELDSLQGAILEMAQQQQIQTPCNRAIYALLHPFSQGKIE
jgi:2-dehydropantoate 2-reductase